MKNYKVPTLLSSLWRVNFRATISKLFIISLLIFSGIQTSFAQVSDQWVFVGTDAKDVRFFVQRPSDAFIQAGNSIKKVWIKLLYRDYSYQTDLNEWRCGKRQFSTIKANFYSSDGELFKTFEVKRKWQEFPPDSSADKIYKFVCGEVTLINENTEIERIDKDLIKVKVKLANIRQSPAIDAAVIGQVQRYAEFRLTGNKSGGWYQITIADSSILLPQFRNMETAWIHGNTIEFIETMLVSLPNREVIN